MHAVLLLAIISSVAIATLVVSLWRKRLRGPRPEAISPGRAVIAANLVRSRRRTG
jgi:hypothetical protein